MTPRFSLFILATSLAFSAGLPWAFGQQPGLVGSTQREIYQRERYVQYAQEQINKGAEAMMAQDFESAYTYYKSAVDALPAGGTATAAERKNALDGFSRAAVSLARQRISEGRYTDAEMLVGVVLDSRYNPSYAPAVELSQQLRDPGHFNKTITPGFVADVEEVKRLLGEASGYYQSGRYDLAFRRYEQVLNIDKYNIAARRGMEQINQQRKLYQDAAYNETRSEMFNQVEKGWELPVRRYDTGISAIIEQPEIDLSGRSNINRKLDEIIIPKIEFHEATVREAIDFVKQRAAALDTSEPKGVNVVLQLDPAAEAAESMTRITLELSQIPLRFALESIATAAGLKVKVEPYAVAIVPLSETTDVLITKEYNVPPSFVNTLPGGAEASGGSSGGSPIAPGGITTRQGVQQYLEAQGVTFPTGSSAQYLPSTSKLIIRNTQNNLDLIDNLIEISLSTPPTQIEIQAKFLEVSQNNLKELGFDWLLGQFALPFGTGVYGGGGTTGNQVNNNSYYPIQNQSGIPIGLSNGSTTTSSGSTVINGTGQVTAGNRSGGTAVKASALDGLLFGSPVGPAAGIMSIAGIFTNPQFQVVLRALDQQKGIDLMSAPSVVTQTGKQASIEIVREFRYPTEYDPPQVPQSQSSGSVQPVTPATPSGFETRNLGVTLQVEPTVGPDGFTIDLHLRPQVSEFDGFVNYGSPINTIAPIMRNGIVLSDNGAGLSPIPIGTRSILLTENVINQPIFSIREVDTNVTIYDGQTVVLGGLMREDVQKSEDKTPIIGDIPLVGRLFRTSADQRIKRNLIIFVTANLIDPAGQPLIKTIEDDQEIAAPSATEALSEIIPGEAASITAP